MEVTGYVKSSCLVVQFFDEVDEHHADEIRRSFDRLLETRSYRAVVMDFAAVKFMDSTGIGILLGRYKRLKAMRVPLFLMNPNLACDKLFTISGIYRIIERIDHLDQINGWEAL